jgi:hypothetical protein
MKRLFLSIWVSSVLVLFAAELEIINGHTLPPEPDPVVNNSTLLGIDVNENRVRDDVERWIYKTFKDKHPVHIDIAMQAARSYKKVIQTPEKAKEIHDEVNAPFFVVHIINMTQNILMSRS